MISCYPLGFYIGSTATSFKRRLSNHLISLSQKRNPNRRLQEAWNETSGKGFVFSVLSVVDGDARQIRKEEQIFLDKYADDSGLFNIEPFAEKNKRYVVTDPSGVEYFTDILPAFCLEHGLLDTRMRDCARGAAVSHRGWQCRYEGEPPRAIDRTAKLRKAYVVTTPDGVEIKTDNLPKLCKDHGLGWAGQIGLGRVARGQISNHKGWLCRFADGSSPAYQDGNARKRRSYIVTSPSQEVFHVDHLAAFCEEHGLGRNGRIGLGKVARGDAPSYKGWLCDFD